jgi:hypothetical protein
MKQAIAISTTRHSEFFRRLLDRYASSCRLEIDCTPYGPSDVEQLKVTWCTNKKIRGTREFSLHDGQRFVASFHDSVDELFIAEEERDWIHRLSEEHLLRYRVSPVVVSPSLASRIKGWFKSILAR